MITAMNPARCTVPALPARQRVCMHGSWHRAISTIMAKYSHDLSLARVREAMEPSWDRERFDRCRFQFDNCDDGAFHPERWMRLAALAQRAIDLRHTAQGELATLLDDIIAELV